MTSSKYFSLRSGLLAATIIASPLLLVLPNTASAQLVVGVSVITIAPPVLPYYAQPPMPEMGYIWTPGYWAYGNIGYYWVPGTWILPPEVGLLWTPPYWGWNNGSYVFYQGYWGRNVGYYGGVNYGYGYGGNGYEGGRWNGQHFEYNRAANNFGSVHVANAYQSNLVVVNHSTVSYTGGNGGLRSHPSAQELAAAHESHVQPTALQQQHFSAAAANPGNALNHNNGHPAIAATQRPATLGQAGHEAPAVANPAHPAEQAGKPVPQAHEMPQAQAPHPAVQMNRPTPQVHEVPQAQAPHPAAQMNRPTPQVHEAPQAQASHPAAQMNRPAPQAHEAPHAAAPSHEQGDQKKQ
ncbi:MAG: hypothetical protein P4L54_04500 [Acidocella sp.]|nr:hypothetical protein [Acidocella sp.]